MFQQVDDFRAESDALYVLLQPLSEDEFEQVTQFKGWTINDILQHLHFWNVSADQSVHDPDAFTAMFGELVKALQSHTLRGFESERLGHLGGAALLEDWHDQYVGISDSFADVDPKMRVKWAGPDMSVRSSITARQMETWAHGQAVFDILGVHRNNEDRIRNIAFLGVNTCSWTFKNRGMNVPEPPPLVRLTAPSGETWEWNTPGNGNLVKGDAGEFCQVVTQTRNIADTSLKVEGDVATQWMAMAQCFAGPVEDPPPPGSRFRTDNACCAAQ